MSQDQPDGSTTPDDGGDTPPRRGLALQWGTYLRNTVLVLVLLLMLWLAFNVRLPSVEELRAAMEDLGWGAWFAFIGLYALVAMTPIPVTIMAVTGGLLFGVVQGSILSIIGVLIGCWAAYWLARGLGRTTVIRLLGTHASTVERHLADAGFHAVCTLRLMPGLPYWPVNYGSGAFGVSQRDFVVAGLVSTIPGQVSLVAVGAFISQPGIMPGVVVLCAWAVVVLLTIWALRSWKGTSSRPLPGQRHRSD
ncbi:MULTISPECIES: TVP38/TMEM64 family protein [Nesterenkonia]|uniref:TVP38/TMEM64 family membrane protein n=1 Tax=Nesterenkonia xinjiangensis TaxID=225327 RepID=A0A7Z0GJC8_9MICC|nr:MULTISPECIES: TVP38/TMEM64 family protein [Nesterenkonia]MDZ5076940.1 TVP38/TMEM64 family protein [Nesterenkonia sp. HG001]NYJ77057.1 putative membrane protein YdjX (TVP38/TMEM64 family) [Nesterenkonia xinjiangensis]